MSTPFVKSKPVVAKADKQLNSFKDRPDLGKGMPFPPKRLEQEVRKHLELEARQEAAKAALAMLTQQTKESAFDLREAVNANLAEAGIRHGRYAPEIALLGGRPLKGTRGKRGGAVETHEASAPTEGAKEGEPKVA